MPVEATDAALTRQDLAHGSQCQQHAASLSEVHRAAAAAAAAAAA
ncbi:hypothetical protein SEA_ATUIN_328 [Arthrobacter phage Atuin]|nr:hypothetical protein SEA_ATUIN_127 [Arthrobacter phage Atuin]